METQVKAFYHTPQGIHFVTIFGYATKGVPSLEINGVGKLSKNIKEKLIYITRMRKLNIPLRRFVICVEINELGHEHKEYLKWLEFPLLLTYWYLCGLIPIKCLDNCLTSGWIRSNGIIYQAGYLDDLFHSLKEYTDPVERRSLMLIHQGQCLVPLKQINTELLLEHIPNLNFRIDYIESASATPAKPFIA